MIKLCVVSKRLTSDPKTQIDWKWKDGILANNNQKRAGVVTLISDKIVFEQKLLQETKDMIGW